MVLWKVSKASQKSKKTCFYLPYTLDKGLICSMFFVIKNTIPETASLSLGPILVTFVAGSLAMSTTNGGIGAFPLAISSVLLLFNVYKPAGEAFGWILWGSQTAINIINRSVIFFISSDIKPREIISYLAPCLTLIVYS
ncbi:hypothetical protein [Aquimarina hainanensis]|uniref:hypothetical protein n=1 Tax=Aquimarina hainanensis TaxID=1578017 RepID=UPI0036143FA8